MGHYVQRSVVHVPLFTDLSFKPISNVEYIFVFLACLGLIMTISNIVFEAEIRISSKKPTIENNYFIENNV